MTIWFRQAEDRVRPWGSSERSRDVRALGGMRYASVPWPQAGDEVANTALGEKSFVVELPAEGLDPWQIAAQVRAVLGVATAAEPRSSSAVAFHKRNDGLKRFARGAEHIPSALS